MGSNDKSVITHAILLRNAFSYANGLRPSSCGTVKIGWRTHETQNSEYRKATVSILLVGKKAILTFIFRNGNGSH